MKAMMKKLGMNVEQIEDVESIVIKTPKGNWVFDAGTEVTVMTMQGSTSYQIAGTPRFEEAAPEIPAEDVTMVASQANVSAEKAKAALIECKGDIAEAIMKLAQ